jgi:hypothetical protein
MVKRKLPPNDVIVAQYTGGLSTEQIAQMHGVFPTAVKNLLRRLGVPRRTLSEAAKLRPASTRPPKPTGPDSPTWRGGPVYQPYHRIVRREACNRCGKTENLGIHHKDMDHFNNDPDNLQVLCVNCHMSVHKKAYWDAKRKGLPTPKSNGRVGWQT